MVDQAGVMWPIPDGLTLMPFQSAGVAGMIRLHLLDRHILLADQMGLGKTIQVICFLNYLKPQRVLIVCPASLKRNWQIELEKWGVGIPASSVINAGMSLPKYGITIINYDIARRYDFGEYDVLVCDESHALKTPGARRTKAVLSVRAKRLVFITGTPILNRPSELWTTTHRLWPDEYPNYYWFVSQFADAHSSRFSALDASGASNLKPLSVFLRWSGMIRRLKRDVLKQLPPKTRQIIRIPMPDGASIFQEELHSYSRFRECVHRIKMLESRARKLHDDSAFREEIKALRYEMRVAFRLLSKARRLTAQFKVPYIVEHLKNSASDHQVVFFSHHKLVAEAVSKELPDHVILVGSTPVKARQDAVSRFQTGEVPLFIGSLRAAGVGITLTASSHVVFGEPDWTPALIEQGEDRCHRIGQKDALLIQHLVLDGSLDAHMAKQLVAKQKIIETVMGDK
jgi:SWI/SNF-related matrix-associated actin-dependent regulator 1 of chromatin subfamily A